MVFGIDLWAINYSKNHGIGNYAEQLCAQLMQDYSNNQYILVTWSDSGISEELFGNSFTYEEVIAGDFYRYDEDKVEAFIREFVTNKGIEVYLDISPLWGERPMFKHRWFGENVRLISIGHDLIPYVLREQYYGYRDIDGFLRYVKKMYNLSQYDYIFTNSEYTKSDINRYAEIEEGRIWCIYCSVGRNKTGELTEKERCIVSGDFFLYSAGDAPQKNIPGLIFAYGEAYDIDKSIPNLVITGTYSYKSTQLLESIIGDYHMEGKVVFTGYVSEQQLNELYENCKWSLYPSLYEGFGMPVVEAWEHGTPVLTSDCTSLGEIAKDAAVLVDPKNLEDLRDGLLKISHMDESERIYYIEQGKKRAEKFTWNNTAKTLMDRLSEVPHYGMSDEESLLNEKEAEKKVEVQMLEWERIRTERNIIEETIDDKREKSKRNNKLLHRWMTVRARRRWIEDYLIANDYSRIALYGFGIMAWHLLAELSERIKVDYIIDQNPTLYHPKYEVLSFSDEFRIVDLIIVTTVNDYAKICEKLKCKTSSRIVSLESIIDNLLEQ